MLEVKIKRTGIMSGMGWKIINNIAREVALEIGYFWHSHYLSKHFTTAGAREYSNDPEAKPDTYVPRSGEKGSGRRFAGSYMERKWNLYGHGRPLEYSGESRALLQSSRHRVRAKATGGIATLTIPLSAPNFSLFGPGGRYHSSRVNLANDITAVSAGEKIEMAKEAKRLMIEKFQSFRNSNGMKQVA